MIPTDFSQFIGPAGKAAAIWQAKTAKLPRAERIKALFFGPPGTGKTALALVIAHALAGHELAIEHVNGQSCTVDLVRRWRDQSGAGLLFGDRTVKLVDEVDRMSESAQYELLTYLDRLPPGGVFIGTSNRRLGDLLEALQSRLLQFKIAVPDTEEISAHLARLYDLQPTVAAQIAVGSGGNVRAAMLDAETWKDAQLC